MSLTQEQEDIEDRKELPRDFADRAIARWNEAVKESAEAYRLCADHDEYESWTDLSTHAEIVVGRLLLRAILAYDPEYKGVRRLNAEKRIWEARGIRSHGKLYLAIPVDEDQAGPGDGAGDQDTMRIVVVNEARIVDIERDGYIERD